jgi:hypothetical protein
MTEFLAIRKKNKTNRPVSFMPTYGRISFKAKRRPQKKIRVRF